MSDEWETEEGGKQAGGGEGREIFSLSLSLSLLPKWGRP